MRRRPLPAALLLAACSTEPTDPADPGGSESVACRELGSSSYPLDAPTPLGSTGFQLVEHAGLFHPTTLSWSSGASSTLQLALVSFAAEARLNERAPAMEGLESHCPSLLAVAIELTASTDDGLLDERLAGDLVWDGVGAPGFSVEVRHAALVGRIGRTDDFTEADGYASLLFDATLAPEERHEGTLGLRVTRVDGETASASYSQLGAWRGSRSGCPGVRCAQLSAIECDADPGCALLRGWPDEDRSQPAQYIACLPSCTVGGDYQTCIYDPATPERCWRVDTAYVPWGFVEVFECQPAGVELGPCTQ